MTEEFDSVKAPDRRFPIKMTEKQEDEIDEEIENWAELRRKYWDEFLPMQELEV